MFSNPRRECDFAHLIADECPRARATGRGVEIDFETRNVTVREKGGQSHRYKISREGAKAIQDYLREERGADQKMFPHSPALFLPPETVTGSSGRLTPRVINTVWNEACRWANVRARRRPPCHGPAHYE